MALLVFFGAHANASFAPPQSSQADDSKTVPTPPQGKRQHAFRGTVAKVDAASQMFTVSNENVPGWMPPMTMSYHVSNPQILRSLKAGDHIVAGVYDGDFGTLYQVRVV